MNGKLLVRLVDAALAGKIDQVKIIANILSSEIRSYDSDSSKQITRLVSSGPRSVKERINPHAIKDNSNNDSLILYRPNDLSPVNELILSDNNHRKISQVLNEYNNVEKLTTHNLEPTKTMLFKGPPGVGKTLTAKWFAKELNLPLKIVDLAMVMSSLLGKTGNNIKNIFDEAASIPCVLLLDEFDALAKKRNDEHEIGEMKRLVTVLLQTIDNWPSSSVLIAATNHAELLDPAIWRRFELKLDFEMPSDNEIKKFIFALTKQREIENLYYIFKGMSYSDIRTSILRNKKISILDNKPLPLQLMLDFLSDESISTLDIEQKKKMAIYLVSMKLSQRKVSELLNISRPTIKKALVE